MNPWHNHPTIPIPILRGLSFRNLQLPRLFQFILPQRPSPQTIQILKQEIVRFIILLNGFSFDTILDKLWNVFPFREVALREEDGGCAAAFCGDSFFAEAANAEDFAVEGDFASHGYGCAERMVESEGKEGRGKSQTGGGTCMLKDASGAGSYHLSERRPRGGGRGCEPDQRSRFEGSVWS